MKQENKEDKIISILIEMLMFCLRLNKQVEKLKGLKLKLKKITFFSCFMFIVQCWSQASKPESLKQDTQKVKEK